MRNPVFKAHVAALFEKQGFFKDPYAVAAAADAAAKKHINRGLGLEKGLHNFAVSSDQALTGAGRLAEKVLTGGSGVGGKALGGLSALIQKHPTAAIGTAALAPILYGAFNQSQHKNERDLMNAYADPDRAITASLDEFLEVKAAAFGAAPVGGGLGSQILKGFGGAVGGAVAAALAQHIGSSFTRARAASVDEPKRKALLENLFRSDPVLHDAIARHEESHGMLLEAYGTMVKFAPTLSLDINAARSFLREAVLGGAGVNYATIKNLVDTERAVADSKPKFGGK